MNNVHVLNRQRQRKIVVEHWREFGEQALRVAGGRGKSITIVFVNDSAIKKLNRQFRRRNYATDVLSFPSQTEPFEVGDGPQLGEVVISVPRAAAQAKEHGLSFANEISQLILHGLLHLRGHDHETDRGQMNRLELKLRKRLGIEG